MKNRFVQRSRGRASRKPTSQQERAFFNKDTAGGFFEHGSGSFFQPASASPLQRKCEKCEEEEKGAKPEAQAAAQTHSNKEQLQPDDQEKDGKMMKKESSDTAATAPTGVLAGSEGTGGNSLPEATSSRFSDAIGYDFSGVRIHTGPEADRSAKAVHAKAYTIGQHIVFREGQFQPERAEGQWLLAHELTHVAQQDGAAIQRAAEEPGEAEEPAQPYSNSGSSPVEYENMIAYGYCSNIRVQGQTSANYSHRRSFASTVTSATGCGRCGKGRCVTASGTITSVFSANPSVRLPAVPARLNACERAAVSEFINGTLADHEQDHVSAFNTYAGEVTTPYTYTGCSGGEAAYVAGIHRGIERERRADSNAASAALDPFNAAIPCDCPDPEPQTPARGSSRR